MTRVVVGLRTGGGPLRADEKCGQLAPKKISAKKRFDLGRTGIHDHCRSIFELVKSSLKNDLAEAFIRGHKYSETWYKYRHRVDKEDMPYGR